MTNNKRIGTAFEVEFAKLLYGNGFWVHLVASKAAGQPADIIASKNGFAYLIDAKVCSDDEFDTTRIEENQKNSMDLWDRCGNEQGFFALKMSDDKIYMLGHYNALMARQDGIKLDRKNIEALSTPLQQWYMWCNRR